MTEGPARGRPEAALAVIRIAMLSGVLVFGLVVWLLHRQRPDEALDPAIRPLGLALPWVLGAATAVIVLLRIVAARAEAGRARSLTVIGWAIGEFCALAGGAWFLLARDPGWYLAGLVVLVASYVVLPIRRVGP